MNWIPGVPLVLLLGMPWKKNDKNQNLGRVDGLMSFFNDILFWCKRVQTAQATQGFSTCFAGDTFDSNQSVEDNLHVQGGGQL